MKPEVDHPYLDIACQQILERDGSVYSVQWLDLPARYAAQLTPSLLLERYLGFIRERTGQLIRPTLTAEGIEFRLLTTPLALLSFAPPQYGAREGAEEVGLGIRGGFLLQAGECGRGVFSLSLARHQETARVTVQLAGFCPLLLGSRNPTLAHRLLYRFTQAYIHKVVTVRYLSALYRELTGVRLRPVVRKVWVREGAET